MNRLLAYFGRLFILLCLLGHGASAFASENSCVDEETLKGFYEKFSLLEQEKEALRTKASSCPAAGEKEDGLSVPLSQKEGRALRYLESKVAQLEEENGKLRDKLKALGALPDEDLAAEEPETESEGAEPKPEAKDQAPKVSEPVADAPLEGPVLPDGVAPTETETESPETAPVPEEAVPASEEDKKSDIVPVPADTPEHAPELIETGSGGPDSAASIAWNILKSDPLRAQPAPTPAVKSAFEDSCASQYAAFEKGLLKLAKAEGERKTLQELSGQHKVLISGVSGAGSEDSAFLCPDEAASKRLATSLPRLEDALREAESGQQAIQILYQENRKLESGGS